MKTGVIIGRFQVPEPHVGHLWVYNQVKRVHKSDNIVFIVGYSPLCFTSKDPLSYAMRGGMLSDYFRHEGGIGIIYVPDNPSDEVWSQTVDNYLKEAGYKNITIYGGRDCFIGHYHGKHKVKHLTSTPYEISGTEVRKEIGKEVVNSEDFRKGIIYAVENRYPVAYPTVDIALIRLVARGEGPFSGTGDAAGIFFGSKELLLGRKPGRDKWCFPGGFVDPSDTTLEQAARRELNEEVEGVHTHEFKYVSSHKIDDFRYRGTKDGIMTSLFVTYLMGGVATAADDLEEVKWFDMQDFDKDSILSEHHHILFESLKKHLKI